jgi:hypothetical protein
MRIELWRKLRDVVERALIAALVAGALTYAFDWISFTYRMKRAKPGDPLEDVTIQRVYAIPQKNGKYSFSLAPSETITCGHAIFPHAGYSPCWYVRRQDGKPIQM